MSPWRRRLLRFAFVVVRAVKRPVSRVTSRLWWWKEGLRDALFTGKRCGCTGCFWNKCSPEKPCRERLDEDLAEIGTVCPGCCGC